MFKVHEMPFKQITGIAGEAITRYSLVSMTATGEVKPAAAGEFVIGLARQEAVVGQEVTIMVHGIGYANAGAEALVPGDLVKAAAGKVVKATNRAEADAIVMVGCQANEVACILVK